MAYIVKITERAERDLIHLYNEIDAADSESALNWYLGLKNAILSLEHQPNRCGVIRKRDELRHLLYGRKPYIYRVIFRVIKKRNYVEVLHIRHGARKHFSGPELV